MSDKPWQFQPGHKLAPGGKREGSGRPSTRELKEIAKAADRARAKLEAAFSRITEQYIRLATKEDAPTTRHAMENYVLPVDKYGEQQPGSTTYQFVQFNSHHHTAQLPAEGLPSAVLVGDGRAGEEAGGEVLAPQKRQGQDGPKFHSFAHVPRKRR